MVPVNSKDPEAGRAPVCRMLTFEWGGQKFIKEVMLLTGCHTIWFSGWKSVLGGAGEAFSKNVAAEQQDGHTFSTGQRGRRQEGALQPWAQHLPSPKRGKARRTDLGSVWAPLGRLGWAQRGLQGLGTEGIVRSLICISKRWDPLAHFKDVGVGTGGGLSVIEFDQI